MLADPTRVTPRWDTGASSSTSHTPPPPQVTESLPCQAYARRTCRPHPYPSALDWGCLSVIGNGSSKYHPGSHVGSNGTSILRHGGRDRDAPLLPPPAAVATHPAKVAEPRRDPQRADFATGSPAGGSGPPGGSVAAR